MEPLSWIYVISYTVCSLFILRSKVVNFALIHDRRTLVEHMHTTGVCGVKMIYLSIYFLIQIKKFFKECSASFL